MRDNEHTLASLGQAEVLSVINRRRDPIAELFQGGEEAVKIVGLINFLKFSKAICCVGVKSEFVSKSSSFCSNGSGCWRRLTRRRIAPRGMHSGDIFPKDPAGSIAFNDSKEGEGKVATRISHSFSESGDAEGLAGCAGNENIRV